MVVVIAGISDSLRQFGKIDLIQVSHKVGVTFAAGARFAAVLCWRGNSVFLLSTLKSGLKCASTISEPCWLSVL